MAGRRLPWQPVLAELVGTAALVLVGLSVVILMFGAGSPVARLLPDEGARRAVTGFLFGTTGALVALSPLGKESGAHLNPAVTLAFCLMGGCTPRWRWVTSWRNWRGRRSGRCPCWPGAPWAGASPSAPPCPVRAIPWRRPCWAKR